MGTGFSKKKKQAKLLQDQFSKMQEKISQTEVTGNAGNGLVTLSLNGQNDLIDLKIKPECVDPEDVEGLQDLIKSAYKEANDKLKEQSPQMPSLGDMGGFRF